MATPSPAGREQATEDSTVERKEVKDCTNIIGHGNLSNKRLFCETCGGFVNRTRD